jgi:hypothetical protein
MADKEQIKELKQKVKTLIDTKYGGDYSKAFNYYAGLGGEGGLVGHEELMTMLEDAGIGNWLTRGKWADGIIEDLDTNRDKSISWDEFNKVLGSDN